MQEELNPPAVIASEAKQPHCARLIDVHARLVYVHRVHRPADTVSKLKGMPKEGNSMKLKAAVTQGVPQSVVDAMGSSAFARAFLVDVVGGALGVENAIDRPAEYYVQLPDTTVCSDGDLWGVELRLTGVSRGGRKAKQFHEALNRLRLTARQFLGEALRAAGSKGKIQLYPVMMLDGEIETAPGSGRYSNVLEGPAEWVEAAAETASEDEASQAQEDAASAP